MVQRIHPIGGPATGGTNVTVYLYDDRLLVDLGGGSSSSLRCRFSANHSSGTEWKDVPAALTNCNGARVCGTGWAAMTCSTPVWHWRRGQPATRVTVEVSINGHDFSQTGRLYDGKYFPPVSFSFCGPDNTQMSSFQPSTGPFVGGTLITVTGSGFGHFGDVRCGFGMLNMETDASIASPNRLLCRSPRVWMADAVAAEALTNAVHIEVTLNGQQYHRNNPLMHRRFTYYKVDQVLGLNVRAISPQGGDEHGGTQITVHGNGFHHGHGSTPECSFGEHGRVPASIMTNEALACTSPPHKHSSMWSTAVEVGINGDPAAFTAAAAAAFSYHAALEVHSIFPLGGHAEGGTLVTINGMNARELDHGNGLRCLFGDPPKTNMVAMAATLSPETLGAVRCASPPFAQLSSQGADCIGNVVSVRLTTNNGQDHSMNAVQFVFINAQG